MSELSLEKMIQIVKQELLLTEQCMPSANQKGYLTQKDLKEYKQFYTQLLSLLQKRTVTEEEVEGVARCFHTNYEILAPFFDYTTRQETQKSWDKIPENNKKLMLAVVTNVLIFLGFSIVSTKSGDGSKEEK